jgi:hypothetical protein
MPESRDALDFFKSGRIWSKAVVVTTSSSDHLQRCKQYYGTGSILACFDFPLMHFAINRDHASSKKPRIEANGAHIGWKHLCRMILPLLRIQILGKVHASVLRHPKRRVCIVPA